MVFLAGCAKEPPPISVSEFMENPRLLEATMVRCGQNRSTLKYETDCVNARDAANRIEAREAKARREEREAMSERKRQALRRTQQAAAEARRRALEEAQQAELLGLPEAQAVPGEATGSVIDPAAVAEGNAPVAELPPPEEQRVDPPEAGTQPADTTGSDLNSIREELQRRQPEPQ